MIEKASPDHSSEIVETDAICTLEELCISCKVEAEWVAELVEHGAIDTAGQSGSDLQFTHLTVVRVARAKRLKRDLSLNTPGVALALELLDEIEDLRSRLKALEK